MKTLSDKIRETQQLSSDIIGAFKQTIKEEEKAELVKLQKMAKP